MSPSNADAVFPASPERFLSDSAPDIFDIVVAGGGIVGLSLGAALAEATRGRARIMVVDPRLDEREANDRAVAVAASSRHLFERIGAWPEIAPLAEPILRMDIMDGGAHDAVRQTQLHFSGAPDAPLAHMAFNRDIVAALTTRCRELGVTLRREAIKGFLQRPYTLEAEIDGAPSVRARLIVAADGAQSKLRGRADIASVGWDYGQAAIVATIAHERPHEGRAEQHFLPAGPFAVLPLPGRRSSIVWNEAEKDARHLIALSSDDFIRQLEPRFTYKLGRIALTAPARAVPVGFRIARRFIGERLALVGDAAHVVHPLAGQGLNLGLRDVEQLTKSVAAQMRLGLDPGGADVLNDYERARRFDVAASGLGMDAMNRLFSNDAPPLRALRDFGLRLVNSAPALKRLLIDEAGGEKRDQGSRKSAA
jgi:2-octaprenyl-6-methoxyphenol hydroxylase